MSPTIFRYKHYRFFFFSREEARVHVHVISPEGEAKFWMEPVIALADNFGLEPSKLKELQRIVEEHEDEIKKAWKNTSGVEVLNISRNGVWLYVNAREYFLPYVNFPWFRNARVAEIHDVKLLHKHHLYWKALDVDLELESLECLEKYPLKSAA